MELASSHRYSVNSYQPEPYTLKFDVTREETRPSGLVVPREIAAFFFDYLGTYNQDPDSSLYLPNAQEVIDIDRSVDSNVPLSEIPQYESLDHMRNDLVQFVSKALLEQGKATITKTEAATGAEVQCLDDVVKRAHDQVHGIADTAKEEPGSYGLYL